MSRPDTCERNVLLAVAAAGVAVMAVLSVPRLPESAALSALDGAWSGLAGAILLMLLGHALRAEKMILLLRPLQPNCRFPVYRCLAIGYLFNLILPWRLGELVRAHLLGRQLLVSRSATLLTIVFERILDAIILPLLIGAIALTTGDGLIGGLASVQFIAVGAVMAGGLMMMLRPNAKLLDVLHKGTAVLNDHYRDAARWSLWSGVRFLQIVLRQANWLGYALLSMLMWAAYLMAMVLVVRSLTGAASIATAMASFISAILPVGPVNLAVYQQEFATLVPPSLPSGTNIALLTATVWTILMLPMSLIGVALLLWPRAGQPAGNLDSVPDEIHKLMREEAMPSGFSDFLESYFGSSALIHTINRMEAAGQCRNLRIFTGGSHAITALVSVGSRMKVRKITRRQNSGKLEAQREWLERHHASGLFARVEGGFTVDGDCVIDIEYRPEFIPLYDHIHHAELASSIALLDHLVDSMARTVWCDPKPVYKPEVVQSYIQKKVLQKIADSALINAEIQALIDYPELVVNGVTCLNLGMSVQRILENPVIMHDLASYEESDLHGDLTVDNVLTNALDILVIDPNNENDINDMVVDVAKLYQSLHAGYEFLRPVRSITVDKNAVSFADKRSYQYNALFKHLDERMAVSLPPHRYRAILFHEAVHYCRMLTYRCTINPATAPAFYAVATRLFDQFLAQYHGAYETARPAPSDAVQATSVEKTAVSSS